MKRNPKRSFEVELLGRKVPRKEVAVAVADVVEVEVEINLNENDLFHLDENPLIIIDGSVVTLLLEVIVWSKSNLDLELILILIRGIGKEDKKGNCLASFLWMVMTPFFF